MQRRSSLLLILTGLLTGGFALAGEAAAGRPPLEVFLLSGSKEYRSEPSLTAFKTYVETNFNVKCTLSPARERGTEIPHIEKLETADVLVVFCKRMQLGPNQVARLKRWCTNGKGIVGIRTASHAFQTWLAFDKEILGGDYSGHGGGEKGIRVMIDPAGTSHPVLEGAKAWTRAGKLYRNPQLAGDVTLLLSGAGAKDSQPLAWVHTYSEKKQGRAFYTSMGYPHDFANENFKRLLVNALFWTAKRPVERQ